VPLHYAAACEAGLEVVAALLQAEPAAANYPDKVRPLLTSSAAICVLRSCVVYACMCAFASSICMYMYMYIFMHLYMCFLTYTYTFM